MWQHALYHWLTAFKAAQENTALQVLRYLKAEQSYNERNVEHPGCALTSNPAKCCAECQTASKEYFESRECLCAQALELLRS